MPHAVYLRNRDVTLIDEEQKILRKIIEQRRRRLARQAARKVPRIILDAVAVAHRFDHLQIEARALVDALRLDHAPLNLQLRDPLVHLFADRFNRAVLALGLHHVMALRVDGKPRVLFFHIAEEGIDLGQRIDLVAEQFNAIRVLVVGRKNLDHVAAHAEAAAPEVRVVALVENLHQPPRNVFATDLLALFQQQQHAVVGIRVAQTVDATDRADDDGVGPLKERTRGRQPQLVQLFVDRRLFFNVEITGRNVGLRLIVVVVADEVFDGVVRKELFELVVELRGQRLVVRQNQRRAIHLLNDLGHGEGLARSGDAEQHLMFVSGLKTRDQLINRAWLIAFGLIGTDELEVHG